MVMPDWQVIQADCRDAMADMEADSIDAIVTDPPYGLSFMGKGWDHAVPGEEFWSEALRVAKPGAHLLAFGGTRLYHRLTCAIEDAGWEVRDCLMWLYGSGFPKSHDVSKAIDRAAGAEREVLGVRHTRSPNDKYGNGNGTNTVTLETAPATNLARKWQGWGTALKPAWEPIILARKPLAGTVAANVTEHGTGALNIDGCRVGTDIMFNPPAGNKPGGNSLNASVYGMPQNAEPTTSAGRWPANLLLDAEAGAAVDGQFAGASRFFYCPKASKADRNSGLDNTEQVSIICSWDNEDHEVRLLVDTAASRPKVIAASTAGRNDATLWNTLLFGSGSAVQYRTGCRFIISTEISSTTTSATLSYLTRSLTSAFTAGANCETACGSSRAESAENGIRWETNTGISRLRGGRSTGDASGATFELLLRKSERVSVSGAKPRTSSHPTVKPHDLMRYLCRLITPTGGTVLDPFCGSGSTGKAAVAEGFDFVGIEMSDEYADIARDRIAAAASKAEHRQPELI